MTSDVAPSLFKRSKAVKSYPLDYKTPRALSPCYALLVSLEQAEARDKCTLFNAYDNARIYEMYEKKSD